MMGAVVVGIGGDGGVGGGGGGGVLRDRGRWRDSLLQIQHKDIISVSQTHMISSIFSFSLFVFSQV